MTPEEAIRTLELAISEVEWEYPMNYPAAFDEAILALREKAEAEKNEPLTLDELKGIRREPVFIEYLKVDMPGEWKIIRFISDREVAFTDRTSLYLPNSSPGAPCYGRTWLAYRRKPKEAHT